MIKILTALVVGLVSCLVVGLTVSFIYELTLELNRLDFEENEEENTDEEI